MDKSHIHVYHHCLFSRVPLIIEIWHRDPLTKDVLLGVASVTLAHVFAAKKLKAMVSTVSKWKTSSPSSNIFLVFFKTIELNWISPQNIITNKYII